MLKAVVFDFDGIIVDSEPLHYRAFQRILEPMGLGFTWEEYVDRYMGFDDRDAFHEAFSAKGLHLDVARQAELVFAKAAVFQEVIKDGVEPYPGVVELVSALSGKVPLALCSGALRSDIVPVLGLLSLTEAFDSMVTADEVLSSKPDPESYLLAVERLRLKFPGNAITHAESVAIEDTPAGIASATGAGLAVLAVTNSYPPAELLKATRIVDSLAGIDLEQLSQLV
jgi:beta-phosphoglucomutase